MSDEQISVLGQTRQGISVAAGISAEHDSSAGDLHKPCQSGRMAVIRADCIDGETGILEHLHRNIAGYDVVWFQPVRPAIVHDTRHITPGAVRRPEEIIEKFDGGREGLPRGWTEYR